MANVNKRGNWSSWLEFLFSCIGCVVGLGNIWRFPYLCYKNGGGAFLIPFFFFMVIAAIPMVFIEMAYSQFANLGPGRVWIICPIFKGIGCGMIILSGIISLYYNVIMAWTLYYLFMSMRATVPWGHCNNDWNTKDCYTRGSDRYNGTNGTNYSVNGSSWKASEDDISEFNFTGAKKSPSEEFWERHVLNMTDGVEDLGIIRWQLLLCLSTAWLCVFLCLIKGIKSSGKVVYVAAILPYIFLIILLVRGATLPGALDGIKYYIFPDWTKLTDFTVWKDAAVQIFFSVGIGMGGLATLSSYNNFHSNCYRDAILLPIIDGVTSWFAGTVIFCVLGFMAQERQIDISEVVSKGPGLAFIVYPEALAKLPFAPLWSVFFFVMLFLVGLDSQFVHVQTVVTGIIDMYPKYLIRYKVRVTAMVCFLEFIFGLSCITQGGVYILQIIDWYCASVSVMLLAFLEIVAIAWIYGIPRLYSDISLMIGFRPSSIWKPIWLVVAPSVIFFFWIATLVFHTPIQYGHKEMYPSWALAVGWVIALISIVPVPLAAIHEIWKRHETFLENPRQVLQPMPQWGPALPEYRQEYKYALELT